MSIESKDAEIEIIDKRSDLAFYAALAGFVAMMTSSNLGTLGADSPNFLMLGSVVGECAAIADFLSLEIGRDRVRRQLLEENSQRLQEGLDNLGSRLTRRR